MKYSSVRTKLNVTLMLTFTVGIFLLLVKLGLWQLDKGQNKQVWQQQLQIKQAANPLQWQELQQLKDNYHGYYADLATLTSRAPLIILDNQILQGQVGYRVFEIREQAHGDSAILVELGFVGANANRQQLPQLMRLPAEARLQGRLYQKQTNRLSHALDSELMMDGSGQQSVVRIQNLNLPQLADQLGLALLPAILLPTQLAQPDWPRVWQSPPISVEKHFGYALQWFVMALVFAGLVIRLGWLQHKNSKEREHAKQQ
ncbi:SURF1 family protein [Shewanella sp. NIFS-20-20]|uniref:SURF1 family protein n=1 Tax=Shewanella sp. NIFS-20-20 TaxID=2853806 RepID=UPI001C491A5B|nr:SURF1 family protein [Shewanella sp. NIFS-20-20]MBV7316934.1 SURF1 family protein [Shewanella sp. NIFS-20-20]